jgi:thiol-disulfide isomerase/thioredoxin/outer membrane lipoprotein-sorting protein
MRLKQLVKVSASCALVAGLTALSLYGQTAAQPPAPEGEVSSSAAPTPQVSADARALLDKIRDGYAKLTALDVAGNVSIAFDGGGQQRNDHASFTGAFRSPNKFRHDMKDEATIVSTGEKVYTYIARKNAYVTDDAPKSRADGLPGQVAALLMDQDPSLALALSPNASAALIANSSDVSLGAEKTVAGVTYPTLKLVQADEDQTLLIDPKTNLIHSVQHDLMRSVKRQGVPNVKVALVTVDYTPVPVQAQAQNISFEWTPPPDAKPLAPATPQAAGDDAPPAAAQLEGKPAPSFTLKTLDGKSVSLSSLKGNVVVLDFWATWCGPCREGLPHIDKIAKDRAADGVKVFAVNLQEDASQIQPFVQQNNLSLPVLLDSDGGVAQKYMAEAIPETVIIDKQGTVQKVIVGLAPDEEKIVNDAIDSALKAK